MAKKFTHTQANWTLRKGSSLAALLLVVTLAASEPPAKELSGRVMGDAVAGVCVRYQATQIQTLTDRTGQFHLPLRAGAVTAGVPGFFISTGEEFQNQIVLRLRPVPAGDNPNYVWVDPRKDSKGPQNCASCHEEIYREWAGSAHGRSATNRNFLDLYAGARNPKNAKHDWNLLKERSTGASVCAACHAPTVDFADEGFTDFRKINGVSSQGVHCDFCHKIQDVALDKLGTEHGRFAYKVLLPHKEQVFFGPLDDATRGEESYSPLYKESRYCASCHEGTVLGAKVYTTYSEWLASPARKQGKQCQGCHMQPTGIMSNFAPGHGGVERDPKTLASHRLPGGELKQLQSSVSVGTTTRRLDDGIEVRCTTLATNVGHRVPTGFIDRHLLLVVDGYEGAGRRVKTIAGPMLSAAAGEGSALEGALAGHAGIFFGRLIADADDNSPVPFWRSAKELSDTRLMPDQPVVSTWQFSKATVRLHVRLIYRPFFQAVTSAKGWANRDIIVHEEIIPLRK